MSFELSYEPAVNLRNIDSEDVQPTKKDTKNSLVKEVSRLIRRWLDVSTKRSQRLLAYRTGVSVSTINRFLLDKIPDDKPPSFDLVLKLLKEVASKEESQSIIKNSMGETGRLMMEVFVSDHKTKPDMDYSGDLLNKILQDPIGFRILIMASNHCGTSVNDLQRIMGDDAVEKMKELVESEILYMNSQGRIFNVNPEFCIDDWATLSQMSHFASDALQRRGFGAVFVQTEGLNTEGVRLTTEILVKAREAIREIRTTEEFMGSIPCIATLSLARLD